MRTNEKQKMTKKKSNGIKPVITNWKAEKEKHLLSPYTMHLFFCLLENTKPTAMRIIPCKDYAL